MFATDAATHQHTHAQNRLAVIPTAEKLNADPRYTGRGVRIAFLDSGFFPHPDIAGRIVAYHDIWGEDPSLDAITHPQGRHWHGTQTAVTCAGNGSLSDGIYRGLASSAELVLIKISKNGRIDDGSIEKGLEWVIEHRERLDIRILNMSLGGDCDKALDESRINRLAEQLVSLGVIVTVAAGNSDMTHSIPPASSPSVITVGGYSDGNQFSAAGFDTYHSSYGRTADGLIKPELIAPAMYVAAPTLPGTDDYVAAEALSMLAAAPDYQFWHLLSDCWQDTGLDANIFSVEAPDARAAVDEALRERKVVATHYQHVDGTSFAAPITASVAAQMIEANPKLTPAAIKNILTSTAIRLTGHPAIRQGFGVLNAGLSVQKATDEVHPLDDAAYFPPRVEGQAIVFCHHDHEAGSVELCGDFNSWKRGEVIFKRNGDGLWRAEIPCLAQGRYRYKLIVDGTRWTEDMTHAFREEDGFGGINSVLLIG